MRIDYIAQHERRNRQSRCETGTFRIFPTEAIAVDVSFADQPGVAAYKCGKLGRDQ